MMVQRYEEVPIDRLITAPQIRKDFDEKVIEQMADSINAVGLLQPILTRLAEGKLLITDGELRYRAALRAGLKMVPVIIVEHGEPSAADTIETQLVANIQRKDLLPSERAAAIQKLIELRGLTAAAAGNRLGISGATVTRLLANLKLPEAIRRQIDTGQIPESAGYDLAKIADSAEQSATADRLATGQTTRDAVAGAVKRKRKRPIGGTECRKRVVTPIGAGRSVTVTGEVTSLENVLAIVEEFVAKLRKARTMGWSLSTFLKVARDGQATPSAG